ncbi:Platinum sensitivity protein, partial [Linderina macrospora]
MGSLKDIETAIIEAGHSIYHRDKLVSFLVNNNYFEQLRELHETCEDLEATDELHQIFVIMQRIILLNDSSVLECIVRDRNILAVVGMLEYEPQHAVERGTYREFLRNNSRFKQVVPIPDAAMESKIHQTFRLQYLKDIVLPRILDEGTLTIINSLIFFNHIEIANYFQQNHAFLKELFDILHESDDPERRRNVVLFVRQFCSIAKNLPINYRIGLYRTLSQHGLFTIFEFSLQDEDQSLRMSGADVLTTVLEQDRALVRSYVLAQISQQREGTTLLSLIIQGTRVDIGSPIQVQCCEMLRVMLDTMPPPSESFGMQPDIGIGGQADRETDAFLRLFYENYAFEAMKPLLCLTSTDIAKIDVHDKRANMLLFLCDLLSFMVKQHSYQARYFVFSSGISRPISNLLAAKPKYLRLTALRFIRTCVGMCDDLYNKQLVGQRLLDPIVDLYVESATRDNLITSACRELFKFVANQKIPDLLVHFVTVHAKALAKVPATLEHLKRTYEEYLEDLEQEKNGGTTTPTVKHGGGRMAVSINMLAGREAESLAAESSGHDATGLWKSGIADAVEEAYFDEIDDDADPLPDAAKAKLMKSPILSTPSNTNGAMGNAGDPELDMADIGIRSPLSSKSPLSADTDHIERSPLLLATDTNGLKHSPILAPRQSPKAFRPRNLSNGSTESKDITDTESVDSEGHESANESDGTHRISMADAFPESKLINRKLTSKPLLRRSDSSIKF